MIAAIKSLGISFLKTGGYVINFLAVLGSWLVKKIAFVFIAFFSAIVGLFIYLKGKK